MSNDQPERTGAAGGCLVGMGLAEASDVGAPAARPSLTKGGALGCAKAEEAKKAMTHTRVNMITGRDTIGLAVPVRKRMKPDVKVMGAAPFRGRF